MKRKHKLLIKRIIALAIVLLLLYAVTFGNKLVFPFAAGFLIVQFLYYYIEKLPNKVYDLKRLLCSYSGGCMATMLVFLLFVAFSTVHWTVIVSFFVTALVGAVLSYALCKMPVNQKNKKSRRR